MEIQEPVLIVNLHNTIMYRLKIVKHAEVVNTHIAGALTNAIIAIQDLSLTGTRNHAPLVQLVRRRRITIFALPVQLGTHQQLDPLFVLCV